ncbi:glycosyltransferase [Acetobacter senegalensis]|uniref:glycosyltransferase n=1 Tax=Acetobacter senegalensis TaxID=446692 RepID=UPI00264D4E9F|nr:glycosyltransferase [Acetobacter senegalensis]MDN7351499.1 glycosyltransferase [Acetobacter senegalensis]
MKYLFIHQNFPGQYLHLVRHLVRQGGNEIVFISEDNANVIPGVRRVRYRVPRMATDRAHPGVRDLDMGLMRADAVAKAAQTLKNLGFVPDIILGHHGWGELLNIQDVYPNVPVLGYFEFYYHTEPGFDVDFDPEFPMAPEVIPLVRAKNTVNLLALTNPGYGQTPTEFQKSTYPRWAQDNITVLREGVDLEMCRPDPKAAKKTLKVGDVRITPKHKLVTYVARDLEPYRGFHEFMRALPRVLDEQPDAQVVVVGGDGVSYGARLPSGCWREIMLEELKGKLDLSRIHFVGKVSYETFRALLQRSDAHVYLTYPFVASWSLREAMAMGCALVGSATAPVEEFITDGETGLLAPFTEPERIADAILELLTNKPLAKRLRDAVRQEAERSLCMASYLADYEKLIARLIKDHSTTEQVQDKQVQTKDREKDAAVAQASASKPRRARKTVAKTNGAVPPATPVKAPARAHVAAKKVASAKLAAKTAVVAKSSPSVRKKRRPSAR